MKYFISAIKKYIQFGGRSTRSEFWFFVLFCFIIGLVLGFLDNKLGLQVGPYRIGILGTAFSLFTFLPGLSVAVRRLHDTGRSGVWILPTLLVFLPFSKITLILVLAGIIANIVLIIVACFDSQPNTNKYGPNPKQISA